MAPSPPAPVAALADASRRWLCYVARRALRDALAARHPEAAALALTPAPRPDDPRLRAPSRLFVSWHDGPALAGCIGTLEPCPELSDGVARFAVSAGLHDPRFPPVQPAQWGRLRCEISLLGEPVRLIEVGLEAIGAALLPGRDGVFLEVGGRRAFFLPVVWSQLPTPAEFLAALCRKAGADPRRDGPRARAEVLRAEAWTCRDLRDA
ncbi:MAG: AmmeMemoRadiSam system protein A [Nannocystaceae bacterium]